MSFNKKILIIDDSEADRTAIGYPFKDNFTIIESDNGFDGISLFMKQKKEIVLIFLDVNMPIMNGIETLQKIKAIDTNHETPVILLTSTPMQDDVLKGYKYGIVDFIIKPCPPKDLRSRVISVLNSRGKLAGKELSESISSSTHDLVAIQNYDKKLMTCLNHLYEARKVESFNHVKRISLYTASLLKELVKTSGNGLDLNDEQIELISRAAVYHDIGKLTIPDIILKNERALTFEEQQIYNKHPERGTEILSINDNPNMSYFVHLAVAIARCHHEKWDGSGFPNGLSGDEIPFSAQVVGVALDFDKLSRNALGNESIFRLAVQKMMSLQGAYNPIILGALARSETIFTKIAQKYTHK